MDIKTIINIILIIIIISFILDNINIEYNIGCNKEYYDNKINEIEEITNETTDGEKNNDTNNNNDSDIEQELLDYANNLMSKDKKDKIEKFDNNDNNKVKPNNYFISDNNINDFESNIVDSDKFYSLDFDNVNNNTRNDNINNNKSVTWEYKNEKPINGGAIFNNVYGFNDNESSFAIFNEKNSNIKSSFLSDSQSVIQPGAQNI